MINEIVEIFISLTDALESDLTYTTGGDANWYWAMDGTRDCTSSGEIDDAEMESWMQTTVQGAGTVTFEWKVYSDENEYLEFYIDGQFKCEIYGEETWQQKSYPVTGQGSHTLKRRFYTSDESSGGGCGWVDDVQWSGSPEQVPDPSKWDNITYKPERIGICIFRHEFTLFLNC